MESSGTEQTDGSMVLVTGGAGFIGSHLVDRLVADGFRVRVVDDLSSGKKEFIEGHISSGAVEFIREDILKADLEAMLDGVEAVFHLAANPDVRAGAVDTGVHLEQNVEATHRVLEAMRHTGVKDMRFTSTSTVYGEAAVVPTPEGYGPLYPISLYGASKLAAEAMIYAYCGTFGLRGVVWRFANVVGPRSTHGVIYDFVNKLRRNPDELEILGDGKQRKSYVHIDDVTEAMMFTHLNPGGDMEAYNIGSVDTIDVTDIADIVSGVMGLENVRYAYTGGVDGGRGWKGDVKYMALSVEKLDSAGWRPSRDSRGSVEAAARYLVGGM